MGFPTPFPLVLLDYSVLAVVSLAEYPIPDPTIKQTHTDIDGLWVFDAYSTVLALVAKQLLKVLPLKVIDSLTASVGFSLALTA